MTLIKDPLCNEQTPYDVFDIGTEAGHDVIMQALKTSIRRVGLQKAQSENRRLRVAEERAFVDLLYYIDEQDVAGVYSNLSDSQTRVQLMEKLISEMRNRENSWNQIQTLAVLSLWRVSQLCSSGNYNDLFATWEVTVASWISLLYSESFWRGWMTRRCSTYGKKPEEIVIENIREAILRFLRQSARMWTQSMPDELQERICALVEFEGMCLSRMEEVVWSFLRYIDDRDPALELPLVYFSPTFATLSQRNDAIETVMVRTRAAYPSTGHVGQIRWQHAMRHLIKLKLSLFPARTSYACPS